MNWIGLHVQCSDDLRDILLAELSQLPFSTFEETENGLVAFCESADWQETEAKEILEKYGVTTFEIKEVEKVNWNEEWEKNYEPIFIKDKIAVRAPFHQPTGYPLELIIRPQMSFGTGHHATTHLVLEHQFSLDHKGKKVLDVGCGTGVLAIMARKQGAHEILAIDIEDWCVENSKENFALNHCEDIVAEQKELHQVADARFDIILANITKGVHLELMKLYHSKMNIKGELIMSGFYESDVKDLKLVVEQSGFQFIEFNVLDDWAMIACRKL
ncbi:MAG: 50S ribosomal protein L11 methyltransferase [Cyclobacteriaceae bacterium]